ncbi:ShlB/FhaC/HecB family hemolysin secretion/activation protein [Roseateles aquatilis]|nr:ShlB/FhaC/HecB family hemolysin secretion/activation protein [Roseateles aquatilis]
MLAIAMKTMKTFIPCSFNAQATGGDGARPRSNRRCTPLGVLGGLALLLPNLPVLAADPSPSIVALSSTAAGSPHASTGGTQVGPSMPHRLRIDGVTVLDGAALAIELQPMLTHLAPPDRLEALARRVEAQVRAAGRPFARAYVPSQDPARGEWRIAVVEGRYGRVELNGDATGDARPWFADLSSGLPIGTEFERQVLIASQLPGISVRAALGPGAAVGEGDVVLTLNRARRWEAEIDLDNHGNRHSGRHRLTASGHVNGVLRFGDRLSVVAGGNDGRGWQGSVGYGLPISTRGSRLSLSGGHHHYELGGEFKPLRAEGQVDIGGLAVTVPLVLTESSRVSWHIGAAMRRMVNRQRAVALEDPRRSTSVTAGLRGVTSLSSGSVAWGGVAMEAGKVRLRDPAWAAIDAAGPRVAGEFLVISADAALLKQWSAWGLLLRASGQIADKNLDPSSKFVLGGPASVRAWSLGEVSGDHGVLAQTELRYRWNALEPFAFIDAGRVKFHHTPWAAPKARVKDRDGRTLAGTGLGLRWRHGRWSAEGTAAWRLASVSQRRSASDSRAKVPQVWVSVSYAL